MKRKLTTAKANQELIALSVRTRKAKWKARAIELYLKGNSQSIVRDLLSEETGHNFGIKTISEYIQDATKEWRESKNEMVANHKEIELEKVNRIEYEYWQAWERSKQSYKNTSQTKTKADSNTLAVSQVKTDTRAMNGDPRFLEGMLRCVELRNKLLGMEVPAMQINQQVTNINEGSKNITYVRRVVFKTRESETKQIVEDNDE